MKYHISQQCEAENRRDNEVTDDNLRALTHRHARNNGRIAEIAADIMTMSWLKQCIGIGASLRRKICAPCRPAGRRRCRVYFGAVMPS